MLALCALFLFFFLYQPNAGQVGNDGSQVCFGRLSDYSSTVIRRIQEKKEKSPDQGAPYKRFFLNKAAVMKNIRDDEHL